MADNSSQAGTDLIRDIDKGGVKTQVLVLDRGGAGAEDLSPLDGTDISSPTAMPAGGYGIRGWLSAIWTKLNGSVAVTGTFFQATQPISAASLPLPTGAAQDGSDISAPTAMPAGGSGIRGWLSAIWTKLNGSIAVTGTFWQATQPVSIAATVNTNATVSNFPATQAISAASLPLPAGAAADGTDATGVTMPTGGVGIRGWLSSIYNKLNTSIAVTGTFWQATQPVSIATMPTTPVSQSGAPWSENITQMGGVALAAVAKGTQGTNAIPTQDLKDSGRVAISFTAEFSPTATTEAMLTMSVSKDGATATTGTSYVITSGKRLRLSSKSVAVENTLGTSIQRAYLRTRFAASGGALVTSPLQANCVAAAAGTVKSIGSNFDDYPDGLEFLGDGTKAIGWSLQAPDWVSATSTCKVYVTIIAYEY